MRTVPTASDARAVQVAHKQGQQVVGIEHMGSAHNETQLRLTSVVRQRPHPGHETFDLGPTGPGGGEAHITSTRSPAADSRRDPPTAKATELLRRIPISRGD